MYSMPQDLHFDMTTAKLYWRWLNLIYTLPLSKHPSRNPSFFLSSFSQRNSRQNKLASAAYSFHFIIHHYSSLFLNLSFPLFPLFPEVGGCAGEEVTAITASFVGTTHNLHGVNNWLLPVSIALWWTLPHLGFSLSFSHLFSIPFPNISWCFQDAVCQYFSSHFALYESTEAS